MIQPGKILHVEVGGSYGGSLGALRDYLRASDPRRFEHHLLCYYPVPGAEDLAPHVCSLATLYDTVPGRLQNRRGQDGRRWTAHLPETVRTWAGFVRQLRPLGPLLSKMRQGRYDLIHVNNTFTYQAATLIAARMLGLPVVAHVRNPVEPGFLSRSLMRLAKRVVAVNRAYAKELAAWGLGVTVSTCHDGLEPPVPDPNAAQRLRTELLGSGAVLIGSAGRLDTQKGYHDLIRAARIVLDSHPQVCFAVAGDGPLRSSLEQLIGELGLTGRFHLCGFRTDVANFLAALDFFVSSSHWEGLPLVIAEAMILGKAIVATDVGGNSELIVPGLSGLLVAPSDPAALAAAISNLLEREDLRARFSAEGVRVASALTDPVSNARQFDSVLEETLGRAAGKLPESRNGLPQATSRR